MKAKDTHLSLAQINTAKIFKFFFSLIFKIIDRPSPSGELCSHQSLARLSFSYLSSQQPAGLIGFWSVFNGLLMLIHFVFTEAFYLWAIFGLSYNNSKNGLDSKKLICKIIPGIVGGCWSVGVCDIWSVRCNVTPTTTTPPTLTLLS